MLQGGAGATASPSQPLPAKEQNVFRQVVKFYEGKQYKKVIKVGCAAHRGGLLLKSCLFSEMLSIPSIPMFSSRRALRCIAESFSLLSAPPSTVCRPDPEEVPGSWGNSGNEGPDPELFGQEGGGVRACAQGGQVRPQEPCLLARLRVSGQASAQ